MNKLFDDVHLKKITLNNLMNHIDERINFYLTLLEDLPIIDESKDIIRPPIIIKIDNYRYLLKNIKKYKNLSDNLIDMLDIYANFTDEKFKLLELLYYTYQCKDDLEYFYNSDFKNTIKKKKNTYYYVDDELFQKKKNRLESIMSELEYYSSTPIMVYFPKKPKDCLVEFQKNINNFIRDKDFDLKGYVSLLLEDSYNIINLTEYHSKSRKKELETLETFLDDLLNK